jgi:amino acid transporter
LLPLAALIFYEVSGGPFGIEDAVGAGGPLLAILGFALLPLFWSVPEALVTAELATAFPEDAGYVAWVTAAFGPRWGFQEGFWSWASGVADNAVYPVLFVSYLEAAFASGGKTEDQIPTVLREGSWERRALTAGLALCGAAVNYLGLDVVGGAAVGATAFIVAPFIALVALAGPNIQTRNWSIIDPDTIKWGSFINVMFWNLNYWDSVSTLAGEVAEPGKTLPRALAVAVLLVVAMYLLPLLAGVGVLPDVDGGWSLGYFAAVARRVGGPWLAWWVVAAAAVSAAGQFEAEMSSDAFLLLGMAQRGFLPARLAGRSRRGTPGLAIALSSTGILLLVPLSFLQIVDLLNAVYCLAQLLEFAAFIALRVRAPHLKRPFKVPLSTFGCVLMLAPATALLAVLLALPFVEQNWTMVAWTGGIVLAGLLLQAFLSLARSRNWCAFLGDAPHDFGELLEFEQIMEEAAAAAAALGGVSDDLDDGVIALSLPGSRRHSLAANEGGDALHFVVPPGREMTVSPEPPEEFGDGVDVLEVLAEEEAAAAEEEAFREAEEGGGGGGGEGSTNGGGDGNNNNAPAPPALGRVSSRSLLPNSGTDNDGTSGTDDEFAQQQQQRPGRRRSRFGLRR